MPVIQHFYEVMIFLLFLVAVSDVLIDATIILGGEQTLKILSMKLFQAVGNHRQGESFNWQPVEAALFCIQAVAKTVSTQEAEVLPQVDLSIWSKECNFDLYCPVRVVSTGLLCYRYADRPLLGGYCQNRLSVVNFGRRWSIEGEIDRRRLIEGEKGKKKKKKRKRRKKKKRGRRKKYLALSSSARRCRLRVARGLPAGRHCPRPQFFSRSRRKIEATLWRYFQNFLMNLTCYKQFSPILLLSIGVLALSRDVNYTCGDPPLMGILLVLTKIYRSVVIKELPPEHAKKALELVCLPIVTPLQLLLLAVVAVAAATAPLALGQLVASSLLLPATAATVAAAALSKQLSLSVSVSPCLYSSLLLIVYC
ncbi:hypothetical protein GW17_00007512 [Ensete ventricosum]|nr:hypothetical protein GW17_00007512 [Ensete ventricosum]